MNKELISYSNWPTTIQAMHEQFKVYNWTLNADSSKRKELMKLRMRMLSEEFNETVQAYLQGDEKEFVDGLIDLCVIAIGTLDIADVDANKAWQEVMKANMSKKVGVKPGRPNALGLPDLIKPSNWQGPDHSRNTGNLKDYI